MSGKKSTNHLGFYEQNYSFDNTKITKKGKKYNKKKLMNMDFPKMRLTTGS